MTELVNRNTIELLVRLMRENAVRHWHRYAIAFLLLFVVAAATGATAYMMEDVINEIFVERQRGQTFVIAGVVALIFTAKGFAAYFNSIILAKAGNAIVARLQRRMFDAILKQDMAFFDGQQLGNLIARFQVSVNGAREAINTLVLSIGRDVFSLISLVVVMVIQDPYMSIIALFIAPPAVIGVVHLMRKVKEVARSEFFSIGKLINVVKETTLGIRTVKIYRLEDQMRSDFGDAVSAVERLINNMNRIGSITVPMMEVLGGLAVAAAIIYGGLRVIDGGAEPGAFFSFITALLLAYEPGRRLARFNVTFQQNMIGAGLVYQLLDMLEAKSEANTGPDLKLKSGEIVFDNVRFSYNKEGRDAALDGLSLTFEANQVSALVGPSGGGKSTILSLITRLRAPDSGRILVDGTDISMVSAGSLRGTVCYVTQDAFLFDMPLRENIRMGRPDATDAEVEEAARQAFAHDFIMEQPQGYDTTVGEGGGKLSGGQRQRISIARAMLADCPIILLDEATSALDSVSEQKVQTALATLMKGRTTIVIAHRLSTIRNASKILVIEKGKLAESGTHDELIGANGLYAHLHEIQFHGSAPPAKEA
ncbi:MAG: ABC transporter ATP-binding protein [Pseudomonadota bacterium]